MLYSKLVSLNRKTGVKTISNAGATECHQMVHGIIVHHIDKSDGDEKKKKVRDTASAVISVCTWYVLVWECQSERQE